MVQPTRGGTVLSSHPLESGNQICGIRNGDKLETHAYKMDDLLDTLEPLQGERTKLASGVAGILWTTIRRVVFSPFAITVRDPALSSNATSFIKFNISAEQIAPGSRSPSWKTPSDRSECGITQRSLGGTLIQPIRSIVRVGHHQALRRSEHGIAEQSSVQIGQ